HPVAGGSWCSGSGFTAPPRRSPTTGVGFAVVLGLHRHLTAYQAVQTRDVGQAATSSGGGCSLRILLPSRARLVAAFRSRSIDSPHPGQSNVVAPRGRSLWWCPHPEQIFDDGNHRSTGTTSVPFQVAL